MLLAVAIKVARCDRPGPAKSTSAAVAVPTKIPTERPDSTRPTSNGANPLATRNAPADSAAQASPPSSTRRRPSWSDALPNSTSASMTPAA